MLFWTSSFLFLFSLLFVQAKSSVQPVKRRCPVCPGFNNFFFAKSLCADCISDLVREESASICDDLVTTIKNDLRATFSSFHVKPERRSRTLRGTYCSTANFRIPMGFSDTGGWSQDTSQEPAFLAPDRTDFEE